VLVAARAAGTTKSTAEAAAREAKSPKERFAKWLFMVLNDVDNYSKKAGGFKLG
jgi:hypothetical protein